MILFFNQNYTTATFQALFLTFGRPVMRVKVQILMALELFVSHFAVQQSAAAYVEINLLAMVAPSYVLPWTVKSAIRLIRNMSKARINKHKMRIPGYSGVPKRRKHAPYPYRN